MTDSDERPEWVRIDLEADLAPGEKATVRVGDRELLICRVDHAYFAVGSRCPHAAWPLVREPLIGFELQCTLHGARFDVRDGCPIAGERPGPTSKMLTTYEMKQRDGALYVSL